ncbi:MAG: signal peptidase II [Alphaproteobacteria bacterium]|nr:signal peptidase II [Alphaproteobacteria bacterium]
MAKFPYLCFSVVLLILDQVSKWAITERVIRPMNPEALGDSFGFIEWYSHASEKLPFASMEILPFFNIVMVWNQGISFGMFQNSNEYGPLILSALSLVIMMCFVVWMFRSESKLLNVGIAFVIAGALGNIIDRMRFGAVIDFLDFHIAGYHWPAFNVADSCIFIGVLLLILQSLFFETKKKSATYNDAYETDTEKT